jgi:hypothetical protein
MRLEIPPPGRSLSFFEWTRVLTAALRLYLPAVAQGRDRVVWRYCGGEVTCVNDREDFWIRFDAVSLCDRARHDEFTARNFAKTIAGHFEPKHSMPD